MISRKNSLITRIVCGLLAGVFFSTSVFAGAIPVSAVASGAVAAGALTYGPGKASSPAFTPLLLKGLKIHPDNPFRFDFIVDNGESKLSSQEFEQETKRLVKYFLAALTTPENELWVNLSPDEKDRIITDTLGQTDLGKDLLTQDYILKQLASALTYPESELGKKYWSKIYRKVQEKLGHNDIPVDTFNKVWIMPEKAVIYEKNGSAYIVESHLKVLSERDYLAQNNAEHRGTKRGNFADKNNGVDPRINQRVSASTVTDLSSAVMKELVIPVIEEEVNHGENFARLRQICNSLLLAMWYKGALKEALLNQVYADKNKVKGIDIADKNIKEKIYSRYMEAYKAGAYNYIRKESDQETGRVIRRRYFSGGFGVSASAISKVTELPMKAVGAMRAPGQERAVTIQLGRVAPGKAGSSAVEAKKEIPPDALQRAIRPTKVTREDNSANGDRKRIVEYDGLYTLTSFYDHASDSTRHSLTGLGITPVMLTRSYEGDETKNPPGDILEELENGRDPETRVPYCDGILAGNAYNQRMSDADVSKKIAEYGETKARKLKTGADAEPARKALTKVGIRLRKEDAYRHAVVYDSGDNITFGMAITGAPGDRTIVIESGFLKMIENKGNPHEMLERSFVYLSNGGSHEQNRIAEYEYYKTFYDKKISEKLRIDVEKVYKDTVTDDLDMDGDADLISEVQRKYKQSLWEIGVHQLNNDFDFQKVRWSDAAVLTEGDLAGLGLDAKVQHALYLDLMRSRESTGGKNGYINSQGLIMALDTQIDPDKLDIDASLGLNRDQKTKLAEMMTRRVAESLPFGEKNNAGTGDVVTGDFGSAFNPPHYGQIESCLRAMAANKMPVLGLVTHAFDYRKQGKGLNPTFDERFQMGEEYIARYGGLFVHARILHASEADAERKLEEMAAVNGGRQGTTTFLHTAVGSDHAHIEAPNDEDIDPATGYRRPKMDGDHPQPDTITKIRNSAKKLAEHMAKWGIKFGAYFNIRKLAHGVPTATEREEVARAMVSGEVLIIPHANLVADFPGGTSSTNIRKAFSGDKAAVTTHMPLSVRRFLEQHGKLRGWMMGLPKVIKKIAAGKADAKDIALFRIWWEMERDNGKIISVDELSEWFSFTEAQLRAFRFLDGSVDAAEVHYYGKTYDDMRAYFLAKVGQPLTPEEAARGEKPLTTPEEAEAKAIKNSFRGDLIEVTKEEALAALTSLTTPPPSDGVAGETAASAVVPQELIDLASKLDEINLAIAYQDKPSEAAKDGKSGLIDRLSKALRKHGYAGPLGFLMRGKDMPIETTVRALFGDSARLEAMAKMTIENSGPFGYGIMMHRDLANDLVRDYAVRRPQEAAVTSSGAATSYVPDEAGRPTPYGDTTGGIDARNTASIIQVERDEEDGPTTYGNPYNDRAFSFTGNIEGLFPVILGVRDIKDLPALLGAKAK